MKMIQHQSSFFFFLEEIERQIAYYKERDLSYPPSLVGKKRVVSSPRYKN